MTRQRLPALVLLLLAALPGCQQLGTRGPAPLANPTQVTKAPGSPASVRPEESAVTPGHQPTGNIPDAIAALELTCRNPQSTEAEKAEAWRHLAMLYLTPANPARSLTLAADAQTAYLQLLPAAKARQEGEIWLALILDALNSEQLRQQQSEKIREKDWRLTELNGEKQRLSQTLAALEAGNAKLRADIEKLKLIDISVEKKRKSFR